MINRFRRRLLIERLKTAYAIQRRATVFRRQAAFERDAEAGKPAMPAELAHETLAAVLGLADRVGCRLFLMSGTLLGFHRNGRSLVHDHDIDLGVMADDGGLSEFLSALKSTGLVAVHRVRRAGRRVTSLNPGLPRLPDGALLHKLALATQPGRHAPIDVDVFVHFELAGELVHGSLNTLWANSVFDLEWGSVDGLDFWRPRDVERYLRENYGAFENEVTDFDSHLDCPNVRNIYSRASVRFLLRKHRRYLGEGRADRLQRLDRRLNAMIGEEPLGSFG
jgi:hypothetical protein